MVSKSLMGANGRSDPRLCINDRGPYSQSKSLMGANGRSDLQILAATGAGLCVQIPHGSQRPF
ncbi:MAG: hypothetical protein KC423_29740 [Anaerolineales bacterium]|nr:hypothetical protein [Anaerolineales bacterium]